MFCILYSIVASFCDSSSSSFVSLVGLLCCWVFVCLMFVWWTKLAGCMFCSLLPLYCHVTIVTALSLERSVTDQFCHQSFSAGLFFLSLFGFLLLNLLQTRPLRRRRWRRRRRLGQFSPAAAARRWFLVGGGGVTKRPAAAFGRGKPFTRSL